MSAFIDANIGIYVIENVPVFGPKAIARLAMLQAAGLTLFASKLVRMECLVGPLKNNDLRLQKLYDQFFAQPVIHIVQVDRAICERAAAIRATYGFKPLDTLHLAAAIENSCTIFLTNDVRLKRFTGITIEVL